MKIRVYVYRSDGCETSAGVMSTFDQQDDDDCDCDDDNYNDDDAERILFILSEIGAI